MEKMKLSTIAGTFYPADKNELETLIASFKDSQYGRELRTRAVIVPHAGLIYSGNIAYQGMSLLNKRIKKLFIIAPTHRVAFNGLAIPSYETFQTPLGDVQVDKDTVFELSRKFSALYNDKAFEYEHSIEVLLPLIKKLFKNVEIIPVLVGACSPDRVQRMFEQYYDQKEFGFIISSDLSHFLTERDAIRLDLTTANMIETGNVHEFRFEQACGAVGVVGLANFATERKYSLLRVGMTNSAETSGNSNRVVGYGAWALYEGQKDDFVKKNYSKYILELARKAIEQPQKTFVEDHAPVLDQVGAAFVTLNKNKELRGCIGSVVAHQPLIRDLVLNARNAAYSDPRFNPVEPDEISDLKISVSILTVPEKMSFSSEEDLLSQITPKVDGIIISDQGKQALYLPSVWETLPEKPEFMNSLKLKAGLPEDHFSSTFEAYKFKTIYIK